MASQHPTAAPGKAEPAARVRQNGQQRAGGGETVGLLHPGSMGAAVAAQLRAKGHPVLWLPEGRGAATVARAEAAGLDRARSLEDLVARADVVLSLCPPAAAEEVAAQVASRAPSGLVYLEANAVSPRRMLRIRDLLPDAVVVDAAVVGSPPGRGKRPILYVAGPGTAADQVERLFAGTDVLVHRLGEEVGRASALKLSYTGYQKASRVLAALSYALASANGVAEELMEIAGKRTGSYLTEPEYIAKTAFRAWRWGPELTEVAEMLQDARLPDDLMVAARAVLDRWSDVGETEPSLEEAVRHLRHQAPPEER